MRLIDTDKFKEWIETQDGDKLMTEYYINALYKQSTVNAIPIPENATNGDMINSILNVDNDCVEVEGKDGKLTFTVTQDWWNAPYEKEVKE